MSESASSSAASRVDIIETFERSIATSTSRGAEVIQSNLVAMVEVGEQQAARLVDTAAGLRQSAHNLFVFADKVEYFAEHHHLKPDVIDEKDSEVLETEADELLAYIPVLATTGRTISISEIIAAGFVFDAAESSAAIKRRSKKLIRILIERGDIVAVGSTRSQRYYAKG